MNSSRSLPEPSHRQIIIQALTQVNRSNDELIATVAENQELASELSEMIEQAKKHWLELSQSLAVLRAERYQLTELQVAIAVMASELSDASARSQIREIVANKSDQIAHAVAKNQDMYTKVIDDITENRALLARLNQKLARNRSLSARLADSIAINKSLSAELMDKLSKMQA